MKIELRQIECFVAVADELHFGRAATRLHMSQPPLSLHIRNLESLMGVQLLYRTKRSVSLTPSGKFFLEKVQPLLGELRDAVDMAQRIEMGHTGKLVIGFVASTAYTVLPPIMIEFRRFEPDCRVDLCQLSLHAQLEALRSGAIDVGVLRPPVVDPLIQTELLVREPFIVAVPADHAFAARRSVKVEAMMNEPIIMPPRTSVLFKAIQHCFHSAGFEPRIIQEVTGLKTILGLVSAGMGVSLVPASSRRVQMQNVVFRPMMRPPVAETVLAWRKGMSSPMFNSFVLTARKVAKRRELKLIDS